MECLLGPVLVKPPWSRVKFDSKRAINETEHRRICAREADPERRTFHELCSDLGGSQGDIAPLSAEQVNGGGAPSAIAGTRPVSTPRSRSAPNWRRSCARRQSQAHYSRTSARFVLEIGRQSSSNGAAVSGSQGSRSTVAYTRGLHGESAGIPRTLRTAGPRARQQGCPSRLRQGKRWARSVPRRARSPGLTSPSTRRRSGRQSGMDIRPRFIFGGHGAHLPLREL